MPTLHFKPALPHEGLFKTASGATIPPEELRPVDETREHPARLDEDEEHDYEEEESDDDIEVEEWVPINDSTRKFLVPLSLQALDEANKRDGTNFEFVDVIKATVNRFWLLRFRITFEARLPDAAADKKETFEATVMSGIVNNDGSPDTDVVYCGLKNPQESISDGRLC